MIGTATNIYPSQNVLRRKNVLALLIIIRRMNVVFWDSPHSAHERYHAQIPILTALIICVNARLIIHCGTRDACQVFKIFSY